MQRKNKITTSIIILAALTILLSPLISEGKEYREIGNNTILYGTQSELEAMQAGAHSEPLLYFDEATTSPVPEFYELVEYETETFYINSDNPESEDLIYSIEQTSLCSLQNSTTGRITCLVTHEILTGTTDPAPEEPRNESVRMFADNQAGTIKYRDHNFTLIPVNDQAYFNPEPQDQSVNAATPWELIVEGEDQELDYPLNFTVSSDLDIITIESVSDTTARITFNTPNNEATNDHVGNWTVNVNVTDNAGSSESRPPAQASFSLEIKFVNNPPEFTTDFEEIGNMNWVQGDLFELYINATDPDENDTLTFLVFNPAGEHACPTEKLNPQVFPWNITTINSSYQNGVGLINITNLTNDHVACRYVNITVEDTLGGSRASQLVFFNITNINDPPTIHPVGIHGNIASQSTHLKALYEYQVNASDPDQLTYDINNTGILTYYTNDTRFPINKTTGLISFTPSTPDTIGTWHINVTVSDGEFNDSKTMILEIINNSAPILVIDENNLDFMQNSIILINITITEPEQDNISITLESLTTFNESRYNFTTISDEIINEERHLVLELNLTQPIPRLANDQVGFHSIKITAFDEFSASDEGSTGILNFTIHNENDPPFFDMNQNNESDEVTLGPMVVEKPYEKIIYATDYDLFLDESIYNESLTFTHVGASPGVTDITFNKLSENSARLRFTPTTIGEGYILLWVEDLNGSFEMQNASFNVYNASSPPVIEEVKPYHNKTTGQVENSFINSSLFPGSFINISMYTNNTLTFDAIAKADNESDIGENNTLSYQWYLDGNLTKTVENAEPGTNSFFEKHFDFFSDGNRTVVLVIEDTLGSSVNWTWNLTITREPVHPLILNSLDDLTVNRTRNVLNYFSFRNGLQRFYYVYDDLNQNEVRWLGENPPEPTSLTYTITESPPCSIADFSIEGDDFTVTPTGTGICKLVFTATAPDDLSVNSNEVTITITGFDDPQSDPEPSPSGGATARTDTIVIPFEQEVDVPAPLKIIIPSSAVLYENRTMSVPVVIENTWDEEIRGIYLSASMPAEENATFSLSQSFFPVLRPGENASAIITASNYRAHGPYELRAHALVTDPPFNDTATVLISALEQTGLDGENVRVLVTFARDLLSDNIQCLELNELLDRADREFGNQNYEEARRIVENVINGCRYLMGEEEARRFERPGMLRSSLGFADEHAFGLIIGAGILTLLTIIFYIIAGIRKKLIGE